MSVAAGATRRLGSDDLRLKGSLLSVFGDAFDEADVFGAAT